MTVWTADPAADPATSFATPSQGSTANSSWWGAAIKRLFNIREMADGKHVAIQNWTAEKKGVPIQDMNDNRTTWS